MRDHLKQEVLQTMRIAVFPGDGIGAEVTGEAVKVLQAAALRFGLSLSFESGLVGGAAIDATGHPLPPATLATAKSVDAVLFGAVGGPKWDSLPMALRPEQAILGLRRELDLYANLRPAFTFPALLDRSPLRREVLGDGIDILIVRETTSGAYFGLPKGPQVWEGVQRTVDTCSYTDAEIERVLRRAFEYARQRPRKLLTSVEKANVMATGRRWRELATALSQAYPDVTLNHMYADNCAMQLVLWPRQFDVIVCDNTFGDILSDEASAIGCGLGLAPSATLGSQGAVYEPIHGTAPDIAGKGLANPVAAILTTAMLLRYTAGHEAAAGAVERAVASVLAAGARTADLVPRGEAHLSTAEMGSRIAAAVATA